MDGVAFDITTSNHDPVASRRTCGRSGPRLRLLSRRGFIDVGPARPWGERLASRPTRFDLEKPPARERLAESRTIKAGGVAGVAAVGAAGVEVTQGVLAETQAAVLPLVPYLDTSGLAIPTRAAARAPAAVASRRASGSAAAGCAFRSVYRRTGRACSYRRRG